MATLLSTFIPVNGGRPSANTFVVSTDATTTAEVEVAGFINQYNQPQSPAGERIVQDGDYLWMQIAGTWVFYGVQYDSGADSYTLDRESMGKHTAPLMDASHEIVDMQDATWSGGGNSLVLTVAGVLLTDFIFVQPGVTPVSGIMAYPSAADTVSFRLRAPDPSNTTTFTFFVVREIA